MMGPDRKPRLCDHTAPVPSLCSVDMLASVYQNHRGVLLEKKTQLCLLTGSFLPQSLRNISIYAYSVSGR